MNSVITFAGNLIADPELRSTTAGTPVLEMRVAVNRRIRVGEDWKDAPSTFHNVKVWGSAAENGAESLAKGDRVLVHGTLETETWQTEGQDRSRDVVVVGERSGELGTSLRFATSRPAKTPTKETRNDT